MPGYYNSAYGVTATLAPTSSFYVSAGRLRRQPGPRRQTGLNATPEFNGYYFHIGEVGLLLAPRAARQARHRRRRASGGRRASCPPTASREDGAGGVYVFGSQRLWLRNPGVDNSGVSGFYQFGINDSDTLPANSTSASASPASAWSRGARRIRWASAWPCRG